MEIAQPECLEFGEVPAHLVNELHGNRRGPRRWSDFLEMRAGLLSARREKVMFERFDEHACLAEQQSRCDDALEESHRASLP
jgi:hypothetical protein